MVGTLAGLNVLKVISEPYAAAVYYGCINANNNYNDKNILVTSMKRSDFEVSVLKQVGNYSKIRSTSHDPDLGGKKLDDALLAYCVADFKRKTNISIDSNPKAINKLRKQC